MDFDVIVIGSGVAGLTVAKGLSKAGKKVAIVEKRYFGGVVYNVGSTRKKELVTLAEHLLQNQHYAEHEIIPPTHLDWQRAIEWVDTLEADEDKKHQQSLKKEGVTTIFGEAVFTSPNDIKVDGIKYSATQFVIATGAKPRPFSFEGHHYLSDSSDFLTQKTLPKKALFIGAGIISFAFMTIAKAFGCDVTVLQHDELALKNFDQEFVNELIEINKKRGVRFCFNDEIKCISSKDDCLIVQTTAGQTIEVEKVYNVAGRVPLIDSLQLEQAGVLVDSHGIITTDYLQSSQPHIFACGDCSNAPVPKLATYAAYQANYLVSYLLEKEFSPIKYPVSAMSIFSEPRIAQVGVTTAEAELHPNEFAIETYDMSNWLNSKRKSENLAYIKTIIRNSDNRLVGVTAICQEADILINDIALMLGKEMTKGELEKQIFAYPSLLNDLIQIWK
ncbi:dihydrolipoyl dehydrogenase family protein [Vagococcus sp. JNUCC 83]